MITTSFRASAPHRWFLLLPLLALGLACADETSGDNNGDDDEFDWSSATPGDDGAGPAPEAAVLSALIGPDGGELVGDEDGPFAGVHVVVPAGALTYEVDLRIEGILDPTPLAETAERVGPQFALLPDDTLFNVPVQVTVPYDMELRGGWDIPDEECRVWFRDGDGWARAEQIASDEASVTVELDGATTFAAGVLRGTRTRGCRIGCTSPSRTQPPETDCRDGDTFCLEQIGSEHEPSFMNYYSLTDGVLYWLTAPGRNQLALAGFDITQRRGSLTATMNDAPSGGVVVAGEVSRDRDGGLWIGLRGFGNVRFNGQRIPSRFDTGSSVIPVGVGIDANTGEAVRFRYRPVREGRGGRSLTLLGQLSAVSNGFTVELGSVEGTSIINSVEQIGREVSGGAPREPWVVVSNGWGTKALRIRQRPSARYSPDERCGPDATLRTIHQVALSDSGRGYATLCSTSDGESWISGDSEENMPSVQLTDASSKFGRIAVDLGGNVWMIRLDEPVVVRITRDGGITEIPLTEAASDTAQFEAMTPRSIHYVHDSDDLVIVTRGARGAPEFWLVNELR